MTLLRLRLAAVCFAFLGLAAGTLSAQCPEEKEREQAFRRSLDDLRREHPDTCAVCGAAADPAARRPPAPSSCPELLRELTARKEQRSSEREAHLRRCETCRRAADAKKVLQPWVDFALAEQEEKRAAKKSSSAEGWADRQARSLSGALPVLGIVLLGLLCEFGLWRAANASLLRLEDRPYGHTEAGLIYGMFLTATGLFSLATAGGAGISLLSSLEGASFDPNLALGRYPVAFGLILLLGCFLFGSASSFMVSDVADSVRTLRRRGYSGGRGAQDEGAEGGAGEGFSAAIRLRKGRGRGPGVPRVVTGRLPHPSAVGAVALAADGATVVSVCDDGRIRTWSLASGRELRATDVSGGPFALSAIQLGGARAATTSEEGTTRVWDLASGAELHSWPGEAGAVRALAFSPDGKLLAEGGCAGLLRIRMLEGGATAAAAPLLGLEGDVWAVAFGPGGRTVLAGGTEGAVRTWSVEDGKLKGVLSRNDSPIACLAVAAGGARIAVGVRHGPAFVLDLAGAGVAQVAVPGLDSVQAVALSPDGGRVVAAYGRDLVVWNVAEMRLDRTLSEHSAEVLALSVCDRPGGKLLLASAGADGDVRLWEL